MSNGNTSVVLKADDLHKSFPGGPGKENLQILSGLSLELQAGNVTSVIGSSGSGKSTLLHILGGLDKADSGRVLWGENNISALSSEELAGLRNTYTGFVFQFHHLLPEFSAVENVSMPALIRGLPADEASERALSLLDRFGIAERADHRPSQLSGGEQQRVSMARALMNKPKLILADEPTGNLDDANTDTILDLLFDLRDTEQLSVLLITHEKSIAKKSDRILELKNGQLHPL